MNQANSVSKAQKEVWDWKEKAAEDYYSLPSENRLKLLLARTSETVKRLKQKKANVS